MEDTERPEVVVSLDEYWKDLVARWSIHRYEWNILSTKIRESSVYIKTKAFVLKTYESAKEQFDDPVTKVEETIKDEE